MSLTGAALECHYRFILWLISTLVHFPRSQRFLLGDRIQATATDVLERLVEATYARCRAGHLATANLGPEKLREVVAVGTPEAIAACAESHTGRYLQAHL